MEKTDKKKFTLKGALPAVSPKLAFLVSGVLGVCLLALRFWQTLSLMDPATGFFQDRKHPTILPFYILSVGFALCTVLLFYLGRQIPVSGLGGRRNIPHAAASLLTAGLVGYDAYVQYAAYRSGAVIVTAGVGAANALGRVVLAYVLFAALAAVVFLLDAVSFAAAPALGEKMRVLRLIPVVWVFFRTIRFFAVTASYIHSTQLFLTIFASAFLMLFLFEYARKQAKVTAEDNTAVFCATGVIAGVLLLTVGLTDLLLKVTGRGAMPHCDFEPYMLGAAAFCFTSLLVLKGETGRRKDETVPTAPLPEE